MFRAIQIAPVWRAERPQKGRYRQFVQCDIDIIGDAGPRAEAELLVATARRRSTRSASRVRRSGSTTAALLDWMLDGFGFAADERRGVLITIDKLDKIGAGRRRRRARASAASRPAAVDALERVPAAAHDAASSTRTASGDPQAPAAGVDPTAVADLVARRGGRRGASTSSRRRSRSSSTRSSCAAWATTPGTIFELAHPTVDYSLGGGGRYDGMIGRFLGQDVPAVGLLDRLRAHRRPRRRRREDAAAPAVVLVHDRDVAGGGRSSR